MKVKFLFLTVLIGLILFSGCEIQTNKPIVIQPEKKVVLGFSQLGDESDWRTANSKSIKDAALEAGFELKFSNGLQSQENQILTLRSFIAQQVDVIAFAPVVEAGWDPVLQEAKDAGIPVILVDREINTKDDSLYAARIGSDFVEEGRKAGKWLVEKMKDVKDDINIVEIQGNLGSAPTLGRSKGFRDEIEKYPNMKITNTMSGDFMRSKGKEIMDKLLKGKNKKIDVLFAHNDDMALGAIEAIEEAKLKPGKDILIVSVDGTRAAVNAIVEGKLNCSVECNPLLGPQLMKTVKNIISGETVRKRILTEEGIFTSGMPGLKDLERPY